MVVVIDKGIDHFFRRIKHSMPAFSIHLCFYPTVDCFNHAIVRRSCNARHRANYVIIFVSIAECCRGIDGSLVGVQSDWVFLFLCHFYEIFQTIVIRFDVSCSLSNVA